MSKQILNQRYCYKLTSDFINRNKGIVKINNINTAIKQRYIIGLGDSTGTRMIRTLTNSKYDEKYINELKSKLKEDTKKYLKNNSKELKKDISKTRKDIKVAQLQDCICNVEFKSNKHYDKYSEEGFYINNKHYSLLIGTPNGIKKGIAMFIRSDILDKMEYKLNNNANFGYEELNKETGELKQLKVLPSKIMGYKSLCFSASTPVKWTDKVLVVKDIETIINKDVIEVKYGENGQEPYTKKVNNKEILINACDGCGLVRPSIAEEWAYNYLEEDYVPTAFCIRNAWTKGIVTKFNFEDYCKKVLNTEIVKDVWEKEHRLSDIDIILNESMLKLNKPYYNSIEEYLNYSKKNGYELSITKYSPKKLENERTLNYQYVQCLDLEDNDINELLKDNIKEIKEILGCDPVKSILFSKGKNLNDKNVWFSKDNNDTYAKALMVNKDCINDDYITTKIKRSIIKKVNQLKTAKIKVKGNYQIAIGDPVIQLESMCGVKNPKGLLNEGEFYIEYWRQQNVDMVGGFRSPMSCKENAVLMNICNRKEVVDYYKDLYGVIVFNSKDTTMMACNGEDFDGDINFTTDNKIILKGINKLPALDCDSMSSDKIFNPKKEDFINSIKNSFGNKVGSVTNIGSSFYDKQSLFKKDSLEYKELDKRIQIIQLIQQSCIDSAKQGKPPEPIPSVWFDDRCEELKLNKVKIGDNINLITNTYEEIKEKEFLKSICADKKPYYFKYIYNDSKVEYDSYKKEVDIMCLRQFRITLDELINKKNKTLFEKDKLNYYLSKNPLSDNNCIVNKIAHVVENEFDKIILDENKNKEFDYNMYMNSKVEGVDKNIVQKIKKIYKDYKMSNNNKNNTLNTSSDREDNSNNNIQELSCIKEDLLKLNENILELTDILIYLSYEKDVVSKTFAWTMFGDIIINNLLIKNNNIITYPIKDENGNIYFSGDKFSEKELVINKEDV